MVNIKFNSIGFTLFRFGKYQIELWFCSPSAHIPLHKHNNTDSTIRHIYGKVRFEKVDNNTNKIKSINMPLFSWLKKFIISHNVYHGATVNNNNWMIFINIEKWNIKPTKSLAKDLQYYV